uniref:PH domain-containing protein n=1 Tax=Alexandrium monilatum TaxID=311494 RepID=A0A7S4WJE2_9DINO
MEAVAGCALLCICSNGVAYRWSRNLDDRRTNAGVQAGEEVVAEHVHGDWVRCEEGWLPLQIAGVQKFEVMHGPAPPSSRRPTAAHRPCARSRRAARRGGQDADGEAPHAGTAVVDGAGDQPRAWQSQQEWELAQGARETLPTDTHQGFQAIALADTVILQGFAVKHHGFATLGDRHEETQPAWAGAAWDRWRGQLAPRRSEAAEPRRGSSARKVSQQRSHPEARVPVPRPSVVKVQRQQAQTDLDPHVFDLAPAESCDGCGCTTLPQTAVAEEAEAAAVESTALAECRAACKAEHRRLANKFRALADGVGLEAPEELLRRAEEDPLAPQKGKLLVKYAELSLALQSLEETPDGQRSALDTAVVTRREQEGHLVESRMKAEDNEDNLPSLPPEPSAPPHEATPKPPHETKVTPAADLDISSVSTASSQALPHQEQLSEMSMSNMVPRPLSGTWSSMCTEVAASSAALLHGPSCAAGIIREGWAVKQSQHVGFWRRRWMVLHADGHITCFLAPNRFPETACFKIMGGGVCVERGTQGPVVLSVTYPSKRRALLNRPLQGIGKTTSLIFDAGIENGSWWRALQEAFPDPQSPVGSGRECTQ